MSVETWLAFSALALVATLVPGPAVLLAVSHALSKGMGSACCAIAGNLTGLLLMSAASVLGLSALVLNSAVGFLLIKYLGAAYLIYLGLKLWRHGFTQASSDAASRVRIRGGLWRSYLQGLLTALSNPKALAFTSALFPQFIDIQQALLPQFSVLVATFLFLSASCLAGYAYLSRRLWQAQRQRRSGKLLSRLFAGSFVGAGVALAASHR